jgi:hypothetical protein
MGMGINQAHIHTIKWSTSQKSSQIASSHMLRFHEFLGEIHLLLNNISINMKKIEDNVMPIGLVVIHWDTYEGATEFFKYPPDFEVSNEHIQQIQISHNFIDSISLHRDDDVNVLSYYNNEHKKVIALFLSKLEDGQDYRKIIQRFDEVLLKHKNDPKDILFKELIEVYDYSFSVINAREEVMLHLAEKVSSLTEVEHDFNKRITTLLTYSGSLLHIKILTALILHKELPSGELYRRIHTEFSKSTFYKCLRELEQEKYINRPERGIIRINF